MPIAQDMKNITEEIEISYGERMSWLADVIKDSHQITKEGGQMIDRIHKENRQAAAAVAKLLALFRGDHKAMAEALGDFLNESESTRMVDFKELLSAIQTRQREREKEVAVLMSQSESKRWAEFKSMLAAIKSKQRAREEEVAELLSALQKDTSEARTHWQNMAKIMASKRTGKRVSITEVPKKAHVPKKVEKAAEEAFGEGDLKARTWTTIEANPQGISLRQIGEELKVPYIRLAKSIKELVRESKIAKRDSKYFPA